MTITELIKHLQTVKRKHGDVEVLFNRYSDYERMNVGDIDVDEAVQMGNNGWVTRAHPRMTPELLAKAKTYVIFPGN